MPLSLQRNAAPLNVAHALGQALELHRQGRLVEAERLYSAILAAKPDHVDALHHLGLVKFANGQHIEALQSIAGAMRSRTPSPQILLNHGLVLNALRLASVLRCPGYVRSTLNNIHAPFRTEPSGARRPVVSWFTDFFVSSLPQRAGSNNYRGDPPRELPSSSEVNKVSFSR